jgi:hypothetical protein
MTRTMMKDCVGISMNGVQHSVPEGVSLNGDTPRQSPFHDDLVAYKNVNYKLSDGTWEDLVRSDTELTLFTTKWFDYRQLTPLHATRLYIDAYGEIYRRHYRRNFDQRAAKHISVISVDKLWGDGDEPNFDAKKRRAFNGCWRGRVLADALGIPYDVYIDLAFQMRLSYWNRATMPQPTHLYSEMVVEKVQERWEEMQKHHLYLAADPAYMVQNYVGARHQDDYHEWLFKQAALRSNPPQFLAQFINSDQLPLDKVEARFDETTLERVNRWVLA